MPTRDHPYGAFNFTVEIDPPASGGEAITAGFSDVSGLGNEINFSDYREGNELFNVVRKIANSNKTDEVTLKRGLIGSTEIFTWFAQVRDGQYLPRKMTIGVQDEGHQPVLEIVLRNAQPKKWMGPTLAAKAGGEVAMEEIHFVHEGIEYKSMP